MGNQFVRLENLFAGVENLFAGVENLFAGVENLFAGLFRPIKNPPYLKSGLNLFVLHRLR